MLGAFALLFVFIVGGQAFPLDIFPGYQVSSSFGDGVIERYRPTAPEWLLGIGGVGAAFLLTLIGVRALDLMPQDDLAPAVAAAHE
jgi:molybdopterin-containing oxidoreductase family membrane subunit